MNDTCGIEARFVAPRWGLFPFCPADPRAALVPRLPWAGLLQAVGLKLSPATAALPDNLMRAVALNRVLEETLRLTPALYFFPRRTTADTWIETGDHRKMWLPKGTQLRLDIWHANRCEEFWGQAVTGYPADSFEPKRWEVLAEKGINAKEMLHFGFGHGPRFCPGRYLGLLEVGLVVGAMVKIFKFKAVNEKTAAKAGVSTKPADGALVDLEVRA